VLVRGPVWLWVGALGAPVLVFGLAAVFDPIQWRDLGRFSGLPTLPWPLTLLALLVIAGVAEEAGRRGWLLPWLLPRFSPLAAASLVSVVWALWHVPIFFLVQNYHDGGVAFVPVFVASLWCGSMELTWLWLRSGGSTLLAILWHGSYDLLAGRRGFGGLGRVGGEHADRIPLECVGPSRSCAYGAAAGAARQSAGRAGNHTAISRAADPRAAVGLALWAADSREKLLVTVDQRRVGGERRERLGGHRPPCSRITAVRVALTS
jgi:membrane protease YdiL (CAAX protease family)